jgi:lipoate-protein ligase A
MHCIVSPTTDPFFNLAAEEYLFRNFTDDVLFLYINAPSVVVGKHQNTMAEINPLYVFENNIKVIRRMSGGGAVYHDAGNLNFSFHKTVEDTSKVRFSEFSIPVVQVLNEMGVPAEINARNDIIVNGFKVSGHAQHVFRNKLMSHGTLLIDSDLEKLTETLRKGTGIYEGKAVQSVRSKVANVSGYSIGPLSSEGFSNHLIQSLVQTVPGANHYRFSDSDINSISELARDKYSTWEWNFGYSPVYRFKNEMEFLPGKLLACVLTVEKGVITELKIEGDALDFIEMQKIREELINQPHHIEFITSYFETEFDLSMLSFRLLKLFF